MNSLERFKTHLAGQYEVVLGLKLGDSQLRKTNQPVWLDEEDQAWLLDGEIGLALRIVPYLNAEQDLNSDMQHILNTATLLQPRHGITEDEADKSGIWQLAILWIVEKPDLGNTWRNAIADIRKESGFSEEIGLDAVLVTEGADLNVACLQHGLPQLLLHTRRLFSMSWSKIPGWLSANARVAEMLKKFPDRFTADMEASQLARTLILDTLRNGTFDSPTNTDAEAPGPERASLDEISINNFRNIGHCLLRFPKDKDRQTQAHIFFGPNGTGKSSIFEALCLGVGGTSKTFGEFSRDTDVESGTRDYSATILSPLKGTYTPEVSINGKSIPLGLINNSQAHWRDLDGSFLGQEDSREFLGISGNDLGQRILKDYSTLADKVTELASTRERSAKDEKAAWLREHGLNAAITRRETRAQKLIEGELQKESLQPSQSLLNWLQTTSLLISSLGDEGQRVAVRWQQWRDQQGRVVGKMAAGVLSGKAPSIRQASTEWLKARNTLLSDTQALVSRASSLIEPLRSRLVGVANELDAWGEWLIRQARQVGTSSNQEQREVMRQLETTREEVKTLRQRIALERKHAAHLNQLRTEFLPIWSQGNPNICPTCGQDHGARGGIEKIVGEMQGQVDKRLTEWEERDKRLSTELSALEARLSAFGVCPISEKRQKELQDLLLSFTGNKPLQSLLISADDRGALKSRIKDAQILPDTQVPLPTDKLEEIAQKVSERSISLDAEAERLWPLPERWGQIVRTLKEECDLIVAQHLPDTLQKVWWELALALTAARWNLAGKPVFQLKGQGKLILSIEDRLDTPARYFFNQAERHIMGLAWFFTRYLTHGRFHRALIALDDPAQEMDQTAFRSFARFAQALLRLHETRRVPVQMVLFLHQEDRALDVARATLGRFMMLTWRKTMTRAEPHNIWEVRLLSEGFRPQNALVLLTKKARVSS